jgi:hypothetical protein
MTGVSFKHSEMQLLYIHDWLYVSWRPKTDKAWLFSKKHIQLYRLSIEIN